MKRIFFLGIAGLTISTAALADDPGLPIAGSQGSESAAVSVSGSSSEVMVEREIARRRRRHGRRKHGRRRHKRHHRY